MWCTSLAPGTVFLFKSGTMFINEDGLNIPKKEEIDFLPTLRNFLSAYTPAAAVKEADKFFTTHEIIAKVESHLGMVRRSDPFGIDNGINGLEVVTEISALGFKAANVGGCMQWLMKKKNNGKA